MPRFHSPEPSELSESQRELHLRYTTGRRADAHAVFPLSDENGRLLGPPAIWILSPEIGLALSEFGYQMRWGIHLSDRAREAAILAVGYGLDSPFELFAHERAARVAGWTDAEMAEIASGEVPTGADEEIRTALDVAWRILDAGTLDDASYARALDVLGLEQLFQLVTLVAYYRMVATQLAVFGVLPPA
jgi:alkylhydroperoxidase family enzyme